MAKAAEIVVASRCWLGNNGPPTRGGGGGGGSGSGNLGRFNLLVPEVPSVRYVSVPCMCCCCFILLCSVVVVVDRMNPDDERERRSERPRSLLLVRGHIFFPTGPVIGSLGSLDVGPWKSEKRDGRLPRHCSPPGLSFRIRWILNAALLLLEQNRNFLNRQLFVLAHFGEDWVALVSDDSTPEESVTHNIHSFVLRVNLFFFWYSFSSLPGSSHRTMCFVFFLFLFFRCYI